MQTWQIQAAKARFSDVVKRAADNGPQETTAHGESVVAFIQHSPLAGQDDIAFERDHSLPREFTPGQDLT